MLEAVTPRPVTAKDRALERARTTSGDGPATSPTPGASGVPAAEPEPDPLPGSGDAVKVPQCESTSPWAQGDEVPARCSRELGHPSGPGDHGGHKSRETRESW
jgi:hypothetical protein